MYNNSVHCARFAVSSQSCRQFSRPWRACGAGWRSRSSSSAPDMVSNQMNGTGVAFPPLQTYSEEESMMREAGELKKGIVYETLTILYTLQ